MLGIILIFGGWDGIEDGGFWNFIVFILVRVIDRN